MQEHAALKKSWGDLKAQWVPHVNGSKECSVHSTTHFGLGDVAEIRASMVRKQNTDSRDACNILDLLLTDRFPRIWIP
jgi:hypothetical protein